MERCEQLPDLCDVIKSIEDAIKVCLRQHRIDPSYGNTSAMIASTQVRNNMIRSEYHQRRSSGEKGADIYFDLWIKYPELELSSLKQIVKNGR